jgi:hypothetical protein
MLPLLLVGVTLVFARQPTCAVLLCNEAQHSTAWIDGALDEMIVMLEAFFGGFSVDGVRIGGCFGQTTILDSLVCLDRFDFPAARCYAKFCDFWRHVELFEKFDDDDDGGAGPGCQAPLQREHEDKHKKQRICRTIQQWAAIGVEKLFDALDAFDDGRYSNATSLACAAEKLLRLVTARLPPLFDDGSSYRHQVFPAALAAFDILGSGNSTNNNTDTNDLVIGTRTVRSFRRAAGASGNHVLIATYIAARVLERSPDEIDTEKAQHGITQLLWPVSGAIAPFDKTSLPPQSLCAQADQTTNLVQFDSTRALPCLGPLDFAAVADEFSRCRSFPSQRIRRYDDLSPAGCCSTIVLMANIEDKGNGTRFEPRHESLGYVAHFDSSCTFEGLTANGTNSTNPLIEVELVARVAANDLCLDVVSVAMPDVAPSNTTNDNTTTNATTLADGEAVRGWRAPREGIPITLAPGDSVCVGGERAGAQCSVESECGGGRTCRIKPGTKQAFCYDRYAWSESEPCIHAGDLTECPYGYCYGAADGHDGGAYPLLYAYRQDNCERQRPGPYEFCTPAVRNWFLHPNLDSVQ